MRKENRELHDKIDKYDELMMRPYKVKMEREHAENILRIAHL